VNEQDQTNPVNPQEKMSGQSTPSGDYSSENDMNRGPQTDTNWGQQGNTSRDQGATGSGGQHGGASGSNWDQEGGSGSQKGDTGSSQQSGSGGATKNQSTDYDDKEKNTKINR